MDGTVVVLNNRDVMFTAAILAAKKHKNLPENKFIFACYDKFSFVLNRAVIPFPGDLE
ncbi:hypothetical protein M8X47_002519 [Salmonella enterica]|nr:hypothetical protein [Salmonella enterica]EJF5983043.1 hypothetical protein [Salmonella enterica]